MFKSYIHDLKIQVCYRRETDASPTVIASFSSVKTNKESADAEGRPSTHRHNYKRTYILFPTIVEMLDNADGEYAVNDGMTFKPMDYSDVNGHSGFGWMIARTLRVACNEGIITRAEYCDYADRHLHSFYAEKYPIDLRSGREKMLNTYFRRFFPTDVVEKAGGSYRKLFEDRRELLERECQKQTRYYADIKGGDREYYIGTDCQIPHDREVYEETVIDEIEAMSCCLRESYEV